AHPSDFVMVAPEDGPPPPPPPPPPPRSARPQRAVPPAAPVSPVSPKQDMASSQWELPDIPRGSCDVSLGDDFRLDASITSEDSTTYPPAAPPTPPQATTTTRPAVSPPPPPPPPPVSAVRSDAVVQPSGEELLELSNTVGTAVCAAACALYERS